MNHSNYLDRLISKISKLEPTFITDYQSFQGLLQIFLNAVTHHQWLDSDFYRVDPKDEGVTGRVLYEHSSHSMALVISTWSPNIKIPPHNHPSWVLSASIVGSQTHTFWKPKDNVKKGKANFDVDYSKTCLPKEIMFITPDRIHSVANNSDTIAISMQLHGLHSNCGISTTSNH